MSLSARAILLLAAAGCAPRAPALSGGTGAEPVEIMLERTPCLGACPVYALTIAGDGEVRFVGRRYTARQGEATARIPPARVDTLLGELREAGFFELEDEYVAGAPACGLYATDSPSAITTVTVGSTRKRVHHDYGCSGAPGELARLERRIDEIAGSARWVGRPTAPPPRNASPPPSRGTRSRTRATP